MLIADGSVHITLSGRTGGQGASEASHSGRPRLTESMAAVGEQATFGREVVAGLTWLAYEGHIRVLDVLVIQKAADGRGGLHERRSRR